MEKEFSELEELTALEDVMRRNDLEFEDSETDSEESTYCNVPELKERPILNKAEYKRKIDKDFLELEDRILRGTVELEEALDELELMKRKESDTLNSEDRNPISRRKGVEIRTSQENENVLGSQERKTFESEETPEERKNPENVKLQERDSLFRRIEDEISYKQANEKFNLESQDKIVRKTLELEDAVAKRKASEALKKLEEKNAVARQNFVKEEEEDRQAEIHIPLMEVESVSVDLRDGSQSSKVDQVQININRTTNLKKIFRSLSLVDRSASKSSVFERLGKAKKNSKGAFDCCKQTFKIIGSLLLYIMYWAGLSIVSIAMLVIGSIHLYHCPVQPYIPIYLVVGGALGILVNFVAACRNLFNKFSSHSSFDGIIGLFHFIWFILGCVWVYGVSHVEFYATSDSEYCHKTVYLFAFWLLNTVFILLGTSVVFGLCACCCAAAF